MCNDKTTDKIVPRNFNRLARMTREMAEMSVYLHDHFVIWSVDGDSSLEGDEETQSSGNSSDEDEIDMNGDDGEEVEWKKSSIR